MRLFCSFQISELPIAYRMGLVSLIKESLRISDEDYYMRLYEGRQQTKPFVFAPFLKNFRIENDQIHLDECHLTISSPDHEFLLHLYNGLQKMKRFDYKQYVFNRKAIRLLPEVTIREPSVVFRTQSPLLVEDENGKPIAPYSPEYELHLQYLADLILRAYRGYGLESPLRVKPLQMKKVVIKERNHEFEDRFGQSQYLFFTAYQGRLLMTGHPEDLQLLYQLGLSKRRNQGFGLLQVD
ncbi:MAG: CRISPR-associated endoribonuclease Cas6 [Bacillus thermozeamaize]|uniref:CRISPR-associated endoribonuclease Cas6 n=1 Tax=Bacillus thermozeamaize TaxID=230954 RepID=A0A1Y3PQV4_9BACI|nr:MAG: CRISPR-associated endoribonuclease Cas6 [Bacillus thermozeamaize]